MLRKFTMDGFEFCASRYHVQPGVKVAYIGLGYRRADSKPDPFGFGIRTWDGSQRLPASATDAQIKAAARAIIVEHGG